MGQGITGTVVLETIGIAIEQLAGEQLLLASTLCAATNTLTGSITNQSGMKLHIIVIGATTAGTLTLTGTIPGGSASSEPVINVPVQPTGQSSAITQFEYTTITAFATLTGIACSAPLQSVASISVYGIQAAEAIVPGMVSIKEVPTVINPEEHRGLMVKDTNVQQGIKKYTVDKFDMAWYSDSGLFIPYSICSLSPTITTLPATPTVLKASTAVATTPQSLTTQPTAPGQILQFVVTSASSSGTIAITGVNKYGQTVSETLIASGNGTYYSKNKYSQVSVNGIVYTGLTSGSAAINGAFLLQYVFLPSATVATLVLEDYTGEASTTTPYVVITEADIEHDVNKEIKVAMKCIAQNMLTIGDKTTNPILGASRVTPLGQPLDILVAGWSTNVFVDQLTGTPLTTPYSDLMTVKLGFKTPAEFTYTATNKQQPGRAYRQQRSTDVEMTVDDTNEAMYEAYRTNTKQIFGYEFIGEYVGGGYSKSLTVITPLKITEMERDKQKDKVQAKIKAIAEYTPTLGYDYKMIIATEQSPNYAL